MKCACGCGQDTPIAKMTRTARGVVKGQPMRFVHGHNVNVEHPRALDTLWLEDENGCWIWQGYRMPTGYGIWTSNGRQTTAHRAMWEKTIGPLDLGGERIELHHECGVPACVNPAHLIPLTSREHRHVHPPGSSLDGADRRLQLGEQAA